MADEAAEEKKAQLEANRWLHRNQTLAQRLATHATETLTLSGEFFSRQLLANELKDAVDAMTPENTGLTEAEIRELSSDPKRKEAVVDTLSNLICKSSPSALDKNGNTVYTTREIVEAEQNILRQAKMMAERSTEGQPFSDPATIRAAINELDAVMNEASDGKFAMRDDYKLLFDEFLQPSYLQIANGPPGSGKSTLAQGLLFGVVKEALAQGNPVPQIYATAPSSKAAGGIVDDIKVVGKNCETVLEKAAVGKATKLDTARLKEFSDRLPAIKGGKKLDEMFNDIAEMNKGDILILDEAGLAGAKQMSKLLTAANERGIRLFMLGDNLQIPPEMAGNGLDELLSKKKELGIKTTELTVVLRQKDAAEAQWTLDIRAGDPMHEGDPEKDRTMKALNGYAHRYYTGFDGNGKAVYQDVKDGEPVPAGATPGLQFLDDAHSQLIADYIDFRVKFPKQSGVVMATDQDEADELNTRLRNVMTATGMIKGERAFRGPEGKEIKIGIGDTMMLNKVDGIAIQKKNAEGRFETAKPDDVTSGDQLEIIGYDEKKNTISFKKGKSEFSCDATQFASRAKYGLVLPLREAQGVSRDRAFLSVGKQGYMDKVYTGVAFSRHEQQMSAYVSNTAYPDGMAGLAKEARVFSSRKQLYSDGKNMGEVLQNPKQPALQELLQNLDVGDIAKRKAIEQGRGR